MNTENGYNPFDGGNGYGYGNFPPPSEKKPSLMKRLTGYFTNEKYLGLSICATAAGAALLLQRFNDYLFGAALALIPSLKEMYLNNYQFRNAFGIVYSLLCIGLPFFFAYLFLKKTSDIQIPFGVSSKKTGVGLMLVAGLGIFYIGNILTNYFVNVLASMGIELYSYEMVASIGADIPKNAFEFILMTVGTAAVPALIEEFAFRGVVMTPLRRYGDWFAIIVSAVLFGLIHGNLMQMPFAVVAGVVLGYVCVVTNSIWFSVLLHFMNNFLSLLYSFAAGMLSDGRSMAFSLIYTYGTVAVGVVALVGYAYNNPNFLRLYPSKVKNTEMKRCVLTYFLMPVMIVPLIMIMSAILKDIKI